MRLPFPCSVLTISLLIAYCIPTQCLLHPFSVLTISLLSANTTVYPCSVRTLQYSPAQCLHYSIALLSAYCSVHQSYISGLVYILYTNFLLCAETNKRLYYYYYYYIPAQCLHYFPAQCLQYLCSVLIKTLLSAYYIPGQCTNLTSAPVYIHMYYTLLFTVCGDK